MKKSFFPNVAYLVAIFACYATLVLIQMQGVADDPGLGWHIETGRYILENAKVPSIDPFLVSSTPRPWVSDQWFSDVLLALSLALNNWWLVYGLIIIVYLAAFYGPLYRVATDKSSYIATAIAAFLCAKLGVVHFVVRPVILSFVLFAFLITILTKIYDKGSVSLKDTGILALVFILWANLHPSFILGLVLIALLLTAIILEKFFAEAAFKSSLTNQLIGLGLVCALATLINPQGIELHKSIIWLSKSQYFMNLHDEWKGINFKSPEGEWFCLVSGLILLGLYAFGAKKLKLSTFHFLLFASFTFLTCRSIRFLPYSAITAIIPLALVLSCIFEKVSRHISFVKEQHARTLPYGLAIIFIVSLFTFHSVPLYKHSYGPSKEVYPYAELEILKHTQNSTLPALVLAHPNWGGFITWQGQGKIKAFTDDRNTLLGEDFTRDILRALSRSDYILEYSKKMGATHILLRNKDPLAQELLQYPKTESLELLSHTSLASLYKILPHAKE